MPPPIAKMLFAETKRAVERGESLESLVARWFGSGVPGHSRKKRQR
jgi:hypothetical protein